MQQHHGDSFCDILLGMGYQWEGLQFNWVPKFQRKWYDPRMVEAKWWLFTLGGQENRLSKGWDINQGFDRKWEFLS